MLTVIAAWLLADALAGLIHFWEDRYLSPSSPWRILRAIARDNELHHADPEAMGRRSIWSNLSSSAPIGLALAGAAYGLGAPTLVWLTFFFASFGNAVHRFAHVPRSRVPAPVRILQRLGVFISPAHHAVHHRERGRLVAKERASVRFCVMSNFVNPVLDRVGFFRWF